MHTFHSYDQILVKAESFDGRFENMWNMLYVRLHSKRDFEHKTEVLTYIKEKWSKFTPMCPF